MRPSTWKKSSNILGSKKAYGLKISQSIIYVKKYFHMFFSTLKNIIEAQSKKIIELAKPYDYLLKTHFRGMLFVQC